MSLPQDFVEVEMIEMNDLGKQRKTNVSLNL